MLSKYRMLLSLSVFLLTNIHYLQAQHKPVKFGKVSQEELSMEYYELDSSASAVILSDVGSTQFQMEKSSGDWKLIFKRHTRIKILSKDGYKYANQKIGFYEKSNTSKENVSSLKAVAYNTENGKLTKTKMGKEAVFEEQVTKNWKSLNFALPSVKVGTVLEFSYTIESDFIWNLREWQFQQVIPVSTSQYNVTIPEFLNYQFLMQGYEPIDNTVSVKQQNFEYEWVSKLPSTSRSIPERGVNQLPSNSKVNQFVGNNIPAFIKESHLDTYENYVSKISFELLSTKYPEQRVMKYMGTWEKLNTTFLENTLFGLRKDHSFFLKKIVAEITVGMESEEDKMMAILNYVKSNVRWNGSYSKYLSTNLKDPLNNGSGSSAEINLLLTAMLLKAGLMVDPVILSTTHHGTIKKAYATSGQFNYVICLANVAGDQILVDATEHFLPIGVLPKRCLNGSGRIISKTRPGWISLESKQKSSLKISGELKLSETGELIGTIKKSMGGYSARSPRVSYFEGGEEDYIENQISKSPFEITHLEIENGATYSAPFVEKLEFSTTKGVEGMGDMMYLNLMILGNQKENPFKLKERKYPVIYPTKEEVVYYMNIIIPEGYRVEGKPSPISMVLPEKSGAFQMQVSVIGQKITVLSKFNITKKMFIQSEYEILKQFYNQVIAAQSNQIVLKKV